VQDKHQLKYCLNKRIITLIFCQNFVDKNMTQKNENIKQSVESHAR